jgi:hypothetical protein
MNNSEQQPMMLKPKLKLKYSVEFLVPVSASHYYFPQYQYATVDTRDKVSKDFYLNWFKNNIVDIPMTDTKACWILIGIRRA